MEGAVQGCLTSARKLWSERISCKGQLSHPVRPILSCTLLDLGVGVLSLKVPCAPKLFSSSFSYSTCINDFGAATHNERRFQFRLGQSRVPSFSGFHG